MTISLDIVHPILTSETIRVEQMIADTGVYIPDGIIKDQCAHFAIDNLDFEVRID